MPSESEMQPNSAEKQGSERARGEDARTAEEIVRQRFEGKLVFSTNSGRIILMDGLPQVILGEGWKDAERNTRPTAAERAPEPAVAQPVQHPLTVSHVSHHLVDVNKVIAQPVQAELKVAHTVYGLMYDKEAVDALLLQSQSELAEAQAKILVLKREMQRKDLRAARRKNSVRSTSHFAKQQKGRAEAAEQQVAELTATLRDLVQKFDSYGQYPEGDVAYRHCAREIESALTKQEGGAQ